MNKSNRHYYGKSIKYIYKVHFYWQYDFCILVITSYSIHYTKLYEYAYSTSKIESSYAIGNVTGIKEVGGLVGTNDSDSSITNSYSTGDVVGTTINVGGLVGDNEATISNSYTISSVV